LAVYDQMKHFYGIDNEAPAGYGGGGGSAASSGSAPQTPKPLKYMDIGVGLIRTRDRAGEYDPS
jgi:hypothetical protein